MEFVRFADLKPTWDIVKFDEGIEGIPCVSKGYRKQNPLDKNIAFLFEPDRRKYVYYLPKTGEVIVTERYMYGEQELTEAFGTKVTDYYQLKAKQRATCSFLYEMVIGEYLVYRCFEIEAECRKLIGNEYICTVSPIKEVGRYVFHSGGVFIESRDHTKTVTTVDKIIPDEVYDTLQDADGAFTLSLYQAFVHEVKISHKAEIIQALSHVKKEYPKLGIKAFLEIYKKAITRQSISKGVPKRVIRELDTRSHTPNTTVRIEKDLVVVVGERSCKYLNCSEQTRAYFDKKKAYYFRRNAVTGKWAEDDLCERLNQNRDIRYRNVDKDIFDNTCMEKYAGFSVNKYFPTGSKINLGCLLAQVGFLSAEQAAKIDNPVFYVILRNIYEGKIQDGEKSLSELLGITGAQIKFLKNIKIPEDLERFSECMEADDFKAHFSDVKKRMFAVSFYLNGISRVNNAEDLTKEEVFSAAQTLNSLEKNNDDKRDRLLSEYRDYLRMHRTYHTYVANMRDDDPLRQEIIDFGEVPINIKPSKIRDYHNKLGRIVDIMNCSDQITKYTAAIEERHENEARKVEYTNGKYSILMPREAREIIREGRELQHCVGRAGYIQSMAAGKCMILFLRESRDLDTPLITIEVRDGKIRQCYGFRDSYNHNPQIREFVKEYAALQDLTIDAIIYSPETERGR